LRLDGKLEDGEMKGVRRNDRRRRDGSRTGEVLEEGGRADMRARAVDKSREKGKGRGAGPHAWWAAPASWAAGREKKAGGLSVGQVCRKEEIKEKEGEEVGHMVEKGGRAKLGHEEDMGRDWVYRREEGKRDRGRQLEGVFQTCMFLKSSHIQTRKTCNQKYDAQELVTSKLLK
jgi:hypothetical protein